MKRKLSVLLLTLCAATLLSAGTLSARAEEGTAVPQAGEHIHHVCGETGTCTHPGDAHTEDVTFKPFPSNFKKGKLPAGNYYLTKNVQLKDILLIPANATVNICLNGYALIGTSTNTEFWDAIQMSEATGSRLNICDCSPGETGRITQANGKEGGGISVFSGKACFYGGSIEGNPLGGVRVYGGSFTMYGGKVRRNSVSSECSGVGVVCSSTGVFTMLGGSITDNTTKYSGGICVYDTTSKVIISGAVNITGNTKKGKETNVYLQSDQTLTIGPEGLSEGARIGVTTEIAPTAGAPVPITGPNDKDYSKYFTSDDSQYQVVNGEDNILFLAVPSPHVHHVCGETGTCTHPGDGHTDDVTFQPFPADFTGRELPAGNYYLTGNVELTDSLSIEDGATVNLCLNGYDIIGGSWHTVFTYSDTCLNLCDCSADEAGRITHAVTAEGTGVDVYGTFNFYSGSIEGNLNRTSAGGGVYVAGSGSFTMYGGAVKNNKGWSGGGVCTAGNFTMLGGSVSGNTATAWSGVPGTGGGIEVRNGTFIMRGGTVTDNTVEGPDAGGRGRGGGINIPHDPLGNDFVTVSGSANITGNTVGGEENNVYLEDGRTITIGPEGLTERASIGVTTETAPTAGAPVAITGANDTDYSKYFTSDDSQYQVVNGEDNALSLAVPPPHVHHVCGETGTCTHPGDGHTDDVTFQPFPADFTGGALPAGSYYLTGNVKLTEDLTIARGTTVNLCLNGYDLIGANEEKTVNVRPNAHFNLCDCSPDETGKITHADGERGSGINVSGTFTMYGGAVKNNRSFSAGGVCVMDYSYFTMLGGSITGNTAQYGGGVYTNGSFTMQGGSITNNTAQHGGGVEVKESFTMQGGSIMNNTATDGGGVGIDIVGDGIVSVTVSGTANITDNTSNGQKNNVYLEYGRTITVGPEGLAEGASIGVTTSATPTAGTPVPITGPNDKDYSKYFTSDDSRYQVVNGENNVLSLAVPPPHVHTLVHHAATATCTVAGTGEYWKCEGEDSCGKLFSDAAGTAELSDIPTAPARGHAPAEAWTADDAQHWRLCTVCGDAAGTKEPHIWQESQPTRLPTADTAGERTDVCTVCGRTRTVVLPMLGGVSAVVERKSGAPDVTADEAVLKAAAGALAEHTSVTVTLTVEKKDAPADKEEIDALITGEKGEMLYLDLSLKKAVHTAAGTTVEPIPDTGDTVLEIAVPCELTEKTEVTVCRKHGADAAQTLTTLTTRPVKENWADGSFYTDVAAGKVYIYASKFSTYAICRAVAEEPPTPSYDNEPAYRYYAITASAGEGGKIAPDGRVSVRSRRDKTFTVTSGEGYVISDVLVDGRSMGAVGEYTFEKVAQVHTIEAVFRKEDEKEKDEQRPAWNPFMDVKTGQWFHDSVKYAYEQCLMVGTDETHFSPELDTSRAMIATILWRRAGAPEMKKAVAYPDCDSRAYYAGAVAWGTEKGVVKGHDNGNFSPNDPITREQLAAMLWRYAGSPASGGSLDGFTDSGRASGWALDALRWAVERGFLTGRGDGVLAPNGKATRAEAAAMLQRFCAEAERKR